MANVFDQFDDSSSGKYTPDSFAKQYGAAAQRAGAELGVDPKLILGQWGEETGWGKSVIPGTNNLGNIKTKTGGVPAIDNQTKTKDRYAKFASLDDFADHYVNLVKASYPGVVNAGSDVAKFTKGLKGYAEDSKYPTKVRAASAAVGASVPAGQPAAANPFDQFDGLTDAPNVAAQEAARGLGLGARNVVAGVASPVTGIGDILNTGVNLGIRGVNALTGTSIPQLAMPSQAVQAGLTGAGLPVPADATERVIGDVQSAIAGSYTGAGLAGRAAGAVSSPVARNVLTQLGQNVPSQVVSAAAGAGAAGTAREQGASPMVQTLLGMTAGAMPLTIAGLAGSSDRATRNAAALLKDAVEHNSPEEWNRARALLSDAQKVGVPLLGPEALPENNQLRALTSDVAGSPASGNRLQAFAAQRPQQVEQASRNALAGVGQDVGTQEAANAAQEAADARIRAEQEYRTAASGPGYRAQRGMDKETLDLQQQLDDLPDKIQQLTDSRASAVQTAGKLHAFVNEQIQAANRTLKRGLGWAGSVKAERNLDVADQAKGGVHEAVNRALELSARIGDSERKFYAAQDALAQRNLPAVQAKVNSFLGKLDEEIRVAGSDTTEGKILSQYRNELAPHGEPIVLPSQLESVYKANRDKTVLGLNATPEQRTAAGVIGQHIGDLDNLIQDVSPAIKNARQIYAQLSAEVVDPLLKGPIGKLAGRGADAQKEAVTSRMMSELSGKNATPERIALIADQLGKTDKEVFPNMVRSYLEDRLNTALKPKRGETLTSRGTAFRDALEPNPKEAANLRVMIQKTAEAQGQDPTAVYDGFGRLLDVLDATGRVALPKSRTAALTGERAAENTVNSAVDLVAEGAKKTILNRIRDYIRRGAYDKLAKVFTSPTAIDDMRQLATLAPDGPAALRIVAGLFGGKGRVAQQAANAARVTSQVTNEPGENQDEE